MDHIESQTVNGRSIVKVFFHPAVKIEMAVAQITAHGAAAVRQMPPGTTPPYILVYNASSVPILQLALSGKGLSANSSCSISPRNRSAPRSRLCRARRFRILTAASSGRS